jgi:hypothetical protein
MSDAISIDPNGDWKPVDGYSPVIATISVNADSKTSTLISGAMERVGQSNKVFTLPEQFCPDEPITMIGLDQDRKMVPFVIGTDGSVNVSDETERIIF